MIDGHSVKELLSLLDQAVFHSEEGLLPGQASMDDDYVLPKCRSPVTRGVPINYEPVCVSVASSGTLDIAGGEVDRRLLRMVDPMSIPVVSFMV